MTESWLRGDITGVHPLVTPLLYSLRQAREELAQWTQGLSDEQAWAPIHGLAPLGFQLKHIAGSVGRLTAYLQQRPLTGEHLAGMRNEAVPGPGLEALLAGIDEAFARAERVLHALDPGCLAERRTVGREQLPTTVMGLLVHIAEHTQRHVGEAIVTAKLLKHA